MPTQHVSADKMGIGAKAGGKHWTESEVKARQKAAESVKRRDRVHLRVPEWLGEDARKVWRRVVKQVQGLELLDNLDGEMLAIYCDAVARYRQTAMGLVELKRDGMPISEEDRIKSVQSWARIVAAYADKLGFTPAARARLVKRKADEILDEFEDNFG